MRPTPTASTEARIKSILIVDDEADLRELISDQFADTGCQILEAENGEAALKVIESNRVDVLITDIRMPKITGVDLLKAVKESSNPNIKGIGVFLISGYSDVSPDDAVRKGAEQFFDKPIDLPQLKDSVIDYLRNKR